MIGWRCRMDGCTAPLDGGDHGPYLEAVTAHLRAVHGDAPLMMAWDQF